MFQFNWEGIELGGVRSAWPYLPEQSDYAHSGAHSGAHIVPVGPMSASGADRATCWGHRRCLIRGLLPLAQCDRRPIVPESNPSRIPESCFLNNITNADSRGIVIGRWLQNNLMFCSYKFSLSPLRGCSCRWWFLGSWECAWRRGTCSGPLQGKAVCWFDCEAAPVHLEKQTPVSIT